MTATIPESGTETRTGTETGAETKTESAGAGAGSPSPLYVYAITRSDHPLRLDGLRPVGGVPGDLSAVVHGDLACVISAAPPDLRPKRRDLAAHQDVQERLMADGAVLPMRFGLLAPDAQTLAAALDGRRAEYTRKLGELHGATEYNLKAGRAQDDLLRQVLAESGEARRLNARTREGSGTYEDRVALGELVAREVDIRQRQLAEQVVAELAGLVRATSMAAPAKDDFLNVSFLVERSRAREFADAQERLARSWGEAYDFRLRGPLPPYSFVA